MKKILLGLCIAILLSNTVYANEIPTKKVCNKGKCKVVKVHKKHVGKVVPVKKSH